MSFLGIEISYTQSTLNHDSSRVMQQIINNLSSIKTLHYKAQMRFREMGGDTFEIRNFSIKYRVNPDNPLYGYDWEVTEHLGTGYTFTILVTHETLYSIYGNSIGQSR